MDIVFVIEFIYIYFFIYDDLLVMDNDVLCRGKLINYVVFGEVIVILVGDVFLNLAVEVCMDWILCYGCEKNLVKAVKYFFWVFGVEGMIGG